MTRKPTEADKAWEDSATRGEMAWLKDTTFVAADYVQPPPPNNYQPRTWERIAVPPVTSSHGSGRIYKRVPGKSVDIKYNVVAAELDSQGFNQRKRVKMTAHKSVWGLHNFGPRHESAMDIQSEIVNARDQVKTAYKQIARDNVIIRNNTSPTKPSKYDPSQLTFTPRKRHNSRFPVTPPTWETMIAEWQPLIIFKINISDIDDPAFWEQEDAKAAERARQVSAKRSKKSKRRRIVVQRTPLSPISEERKEPSGVPAKYRPMYAAPSKRWAAASDKFFTMTATPAGVADEDGEGGEDSLEITNQRGHFRVPSSPISSRSSTTTASKRDTQDHVEVFNERGHFRVPSSPLSGSATTSASDRKRKAQNEHIDQQSPIRRRSLPRDPSTSHHNTDPAVVAVFDQPTSEVQTEPEHETKRRVSLDNARRSDRRLQMTVIKRVRTWVTTTFSGRRRSFAEAMDEQEGEDEPPRTRRRHTLDVDVGRNPDIFGQTNARTPPIDNGITSIGSGGAQNIDDMVGNPLNGTATLAAREDSPWDVASEFSMAREATYLETATALDASTPSPAQQKVGINWNAITNIDDRIRDLLDRKAALVFDKDDDGNTVSSDGDETELFDENVRDRIMSVLQPDEDEDMTVGDLGVDTTAPNPPATESPMADSPVADLPALNSTLPDSATPVMPTAMETTVETIPNTPMADVPTSGEVAASREPLDTSELDIVKPTTVESAAMIDTFIAEELGATSQPAEASDDDSHAATIAGPLNASEHDVVETTTVEIAAMINTPVSGELAATPQPADASVDGSQAATTLEPTAVGNATISDEPATLPQSADATGQNLDGATPDEPMPDAHLVEQPTMISQPVETAEDQSDKGLSPEPAAQLQTVDTQDADSNDDSQLEMLRGFVRRAQMKPKQAWFSGSPRASIETSTPLKSPRQPLAQKDSNMSPITRMSMSGSPGKKRKLKEAEEAPLDMAKTSRLVKPDLDDTTPQPLRKRRRKGGENDSPDEIFNPEMALSQSLTQKGSSGGPRRSKRVATTKPTELAAPSHIPVRLPGSFDGDMPAVSTVGLMQRKLEKDLTTLTRTNTRRNKGAALSVSARLTGLSLPADTSDPFVSPEMAPRLQASRRGKAVRWDETLARFQGDDDSVPPTAAAAAPPVVPAVAPTFVEHPTTPEPAPANASVSPPVPASAPASFPASAPASFPASAPAESEKKKALRPRPSRLPAAVSKTTMTPRTPKTPKTPKTKAAATPSRITATPTRRPSAVGARLGTPAAKRRASAKK